MRRLCLLLGLAAIGNAGTAAADDVAGPDGWRTYAGADEIAPRFFVNHESGSDGRYVLGLNGRGLDAVDGRWVRRVPVDAAKHYRFSAEFQAHNVATPLRSVLARVLWFDSSGKQLTQAEFPTTLPEATDGWSHVTAVYQPPTGTTQADLELHLRWAGEGEVHWRNANLTEVATPTPRLVRVATVNHRPRGTKSPQENLERFAAMVDQAAAQRADVVCLPEGITVVGTGKKYHEVAEPIPGPSTHFLGDVARKHHCYLVAGIYEREGPALYNVSVLIGRDGQLVGKYRKVCLPREEIDGGITPGRDYPVFDTDFGRVGMMICWDVHFPEVARELAAQGAEMILMPIWGGNETLARARAIENQLYLVASGYDFRTAIFDRSGKSLQEATADPEVLVAEIDLNERHLSRHLGEFRARIWREGPPR